MPVFDQFDIESKNSFQSSSVDRVLFGDFLFNQTPSISGDPRYDVGGKIDGLNLSVFQDYYVPYWLRSAYETGSFIGSFTRNTSFFDSDEYIADTFIPHPVSILKVNAAVPALFTTSSTTPYGGERWGVQGLGRQGFEIAYSTNPIDDSSDQSFDGIDCNWRDEFPFQTKYRLLQKTLRQDASLAVEQRLAVDSSGTPVSPASGSNFLARLIIYAESNTVVNSIPVFLCSMITSATSSLIWKERELGSPSWQDLSKTFYGIGDGGKLSNRNGVNEGAQATTVIDIGRYQPTFGFQYKPGSSALRNSSYVSVPIIRGFKYGLESSIAKPVGARFSRTHFGYLRDMLEQRQGCATINKNTGASIYAPVSITFVSGSTSYQRAVWYATSSTATDFNPRDSGIYDYLYRSGQPFFD